MIDTAHSLGTRVAIHATNERSVGLAILLGADTIEHGSNLTEEGLQLLAETDTIWSPTLSVMATLESPNKQQTIDIFKAAIDRAVAGEIRIGVGGDTGPFPHGTNALELQLMKQFGAPPLHVLKWATVGNWEVVRGMYWEGDIGKERLKKLVELADDELVRATIVAGDNGVPVGVLRRGFAADIIAVSGDLEKDFDRAISAQGVQFVMKGGAIFKRDGVPTLPS